MRKRDELTHPDSCTAKARDDEMTFVLLGRDAASPAAIRAWIAERVRLGKNRPGDPKLVEAERCACVMEAERSVPLESIPRVSDLPARLRRRAAVAASPETADLLNEAADAIENPLKPPSGRGWMTAPARAALERFEAAGGYLGDETTEADVAGLAGCDVATAREVVCWSKAAWPPCPESAPPPPRLTGKRHTSDSTEDS